MPIYFVNPTGSNTSPYDEDIKGAPTIASLASSITLNDNDIIQIVGDNGEIVETVNSSVKGTFRKADSSISKPIIKLQSSGYINAVSGAQVFHFKDLILYKDASDGALDNAFLDAAQMIDPIDITIDSCELRVVGEFGSVLNANGIVIADADEAVTIKNNVFHRIPKSSIIINATSESKPAVVANYVIRMNSFKQAIYCAPV